jgi:hypothetical protein
MPVLSRQLKNHESEENPHTSQEHGPSDGDGNEHFDKYAARSSDVCRIQFIDSFSLILKAKHRPPKEQTLPRSIGQESSPGSQLGSALFALPEEFFRCGFKTR